MMQFTADTWFFLALFISFFVWLDGFEERRHAYILGFSVGLAFFFGHGFWFLIAIFTFMTFSRKLGLQDVDYIIVGLAFIEPYLLIAFGAFWLTCYAVYQIFKVTKKEPFGVGHFAFVSLFATYMLFLKI